MRESEIKVGVWYVGDARKRSTDRFVTWVGIADVEYKLSGEDALHVCSRSTFARWAVQPARISAEAPKPTPPPVEEAPLSKVSWDFAAGRETCFEIVDQVKQQKPVDWCDVKLGEMLTSGDRLLLAVDHGFGHDAIALLDIRTLEVFRDYDRIVAEFKLVRVSAEIKVTVRR